MVLSDRAIRDAIQAGDLIIEPLAEGAIQPASVDVRLANQIRVFRNLERQFIDLREDLTDLATEFDIKGDAPFLLGPGECALVGTLENVRLSDDMVARIEGKSSLNRVGLFVHSNAGYVDPGWKGRLTLGVTNVAPLPVSLYEGMYIAQLTFMRLSGRAQNPYGSDSLSSKYQGQQAVTPSAMHLNFSRSRSCPVTPHTPIDNVRRHRLAGK